MHGAQLVALMLENYSSMLPDQALSYRAHEPTCQDPPTQPLPDSRSTWTAGLGWAPRLPQTHARTPQQTSMPPPEKNGCLAYCVPVGALRPCTPSQARLMTCTTRPTRAPHMHTPVSGGPEIAAEHSGCVCQGASVDDGQFQRGLLIAIELQTRKRHARKKETETGQGYTAAGLAQSQSANRAGLSSSLQSHNQGSSGGGGSKQPQKTALMDVSLHGLCVWVRQALLLREPTNKHAPACALSPPSIIILMPNAPWPGTRTSWRPTPSPTCGR